ncbi:MAG: ComEA family DNA-binding protein [Thermodesulfobacteriota bacterium]
MKSNGKTGNDKQDYRIPVLLIVGIFILAWQGWILLNRYCFSPSPTVEKETVFLYTKGSLRLLPFGEEAAGQISYGKISDLPQFIRPVFFLPVSINKADHELLQNIPGIGPSLSRSIVEFRKQRGEISSYSELLEIRGIGPSTLKKIKEHSTL